MPYAITMRTQRRGSPKEQNAEACATLNAFSNEVDAQTGKKISTAVAASLIAQANGIRAALGC